MGHIRVTRFFYKVRGACQAPLVEGSDGSLYVLKLSGPHGPNLLFNEAFGSELLRYFGLPSAAWIPLRLDDAFIESHPAMWLKTGRHSRRPAPGLHFGSCLVSPKRGVGAYQIIPSSWVQRVKNRSKFIGALAIDIWSNHCDRRQAIYTKSGEALNATFIDNGHMFGGPAGNDITCPRRCMNFDLSLYRDLRVQQTLERWRKRILNVALTDIRKLSSQLPSEWCAPELVDCTMASLQARRQQLGALFGEADAIIRDHWSLESQSFVKSLEQNVPLTPELVS